MGRLFVYIAEAGTKDEPEKSILSKQLNHMARNLWYIITWPSAILTLFFGLGLLHISGTLSEPWMHAKLGFVVLLFAYQFWCGSLRKKLLRTPTAKTSKQLRMFNEVPTVFLIAIIFLAVIKSPMVLGPVIATIVFFGILAMILSKILKA